MALDPNCAPSHCVAMRYFNVWMAVYTLSLKYDSPTSISLLENGEAPPRYTLHKPSEDSLILVDVLCGTTLASARCLKPNKLWLMTLENPTLQIELSSRSKLSWEHGFEFEGQQWIWKRDTSITGSPVGYTNYLERKPDAPWAWAIFRLPTKSRSPTLQLLDYNLERLPGLRDRRGLETATILSVATFLTFGGTGSAPLPSVSSMARSEVYSKKVPPPVPESTIANEGTPNEILVLDNLSSEFLINHANELLDDKDIAFIILKAASSLAVKKSVQIAAEVKRQHSKKHNEDLHQYVVESAPASDSKRIVLGKKPYALPTMLQIYLSRFPLDELQPKAPSKKQ